MNNSSSMYPSVQGQVSIYLESPADTYKLEMFRYVTILAWS